MTAEPLAEPDDRLVDVGALEDFRTETLTPVVLRGRRAVVVRTDAAIWALGATCPHMGADLCRGRLTRQLVGPEAGTLEALDELVISCPWHSWEFAVSTGRALADPGSGIPTYDVTIRDGRVMVDPQPIRARRTHA